ncbi:hypothetical protein M9434_007063 [Picochlorum sp. BPE23]|nr:hypothetical protein M9434_007063 [Picochlorum sp. BPE23]
MSHILRRIGALAKPKLWNSEILLGTSSKHATSTQTAVCTMYGFHTRSISNVEGKYAAPTTEEEEHQIAREALKKMHIDPFDNEYDRFNGSEMELLAEAYANDERVVLDTPVDLNVEMDYEQMPDDILESLKPNVHTKEENEIYQFDDEM